jgi:N,N'-diacetyllegionaminate synthase
MALAKKMILAARDAGADAVKFQFFQDGKLVNPYIKESSGVIGILSKYSLTPAKVKELKRYSDKARMLFFVTPFDLDAVDFCASLDMKVYKIASGDINNFLLLEAVAKTKKPVFFSSGAASLKETDTAFGIMKRWNDSLVPLHCVSLYPAAAGEMNLRTIPFFQERYRVPVGLSDHTLGTQVMEWATVLGAAVIEKHFTLDRKLKGPDHQLSVMPDELKIIRKTTDQIVASLGKTGKHPDAKELKGNYWGRRSFVAVKKIAEDEEITVRNIEPLRPQKGLPASAAFTLVGRRAKRTVKEGEFVRLEDLK